MTASRREGSASNRTSGGRRARRRWPRWVLGLGVPVAVALLVLVIVVYAQITLSFEGRVWTLPSRVYSATLRVAPGMVMDRRTLAARLDRTGYERIDVPPSRPGQYRTRGATVDVYVRGFPGGDRPLPARHAIVAFDGDSVA